MTTQAFYNTNTHNASSSLTTRKTIPNNIYNTKTIDITKHFLNPTLISDPTSTPTPKYTNQQGHIPVQPIIGDDIQKVKDYILNRPTSKRHKSIDFNLRDFTIFTFGVNVGLRIGDLLHLKISDVLVDNKIVDYICIREQKTIKSKKPSREILLLPEIQVILKQYINSLDNWQLDWYLFHAVWPKSNPYKPMTRENMWHKMKSIEKELEFTVPLGTHSLRKSFARAMFDRLSSNDPLAIIVIQEMLGHSSPEVTLAYIGITREKRNDLRRECGVI